MSAHDFLGLLYCFSVLLCICVVSCAYMTYFPTVMAQYDLFVLKLLLNPKQTNEQAQVEHACALLPGRPEFFFASGMSHPFLCLPSHSWYSFIDCKGMEG